MRRACWIAFLLLGLMAAPSAAIFLTCDDLCRCTDSCSRPCRFGPYEPYTNCGAIGVCTGGYDCSTVAANTAFEAIFAPQVCTDEGADAAAPAPAQPAD